MNNLWASSVGKTSQIVNGIGSPTQVARTIDYMNANNIVAPGSLKEAGQGGSIAPQYMGVAPDKNSAAYKDFVAKYPGMAQITPDMQIIDPSKVSSMPPNSAYVLNTGIIEDPVYGKLAPVNNFGFAQQNENTLKGIMQGPLAAAAIMTGPLIGAGLTGQGPWANSLSGIGNSLGFSGQTSAASGVSNTANAVTSPYIDPGAGITGTPSGFTSPLGAASGIPDYTGGLAGAGGFTAPGTVVPGASAGLSGAGALAAGASAVGAGSTLLDTLNGGLDTVNQFARTPLGNLLQTLLGTGFQAFVNSDLGRQLSHIATQAADRNDSLMQPQRLPYQGQLANLLTPEGAKGFMANDPGVQGSLGVANNAFQGASSKQGTGGTVFSDYLRNIADITGSQYNNRINQLTTLGGFGFAPNGGNIYGGIGAAGATANNAAYTGVGQALAGGIPYMINTPTNMGTPPPLSQSTDMTGFNNQNAMWMS